MSRATRLLVALAAVLPVHKFGCVPFYGILLYDPCMLFAGPVSLSKTIALSVLPSRQAKSAGNNFGIRPALGLERAVDVWALGFGSGVQDVGLCFLV